MAYNSRRIRATSDLTTRQQNRAGIMATQRASTPANPRLVGCLRGLCLTAIVTLIISFEATCSAQSLEDISATLKAQSESIKSICVRYHYSSVARGTADDISTYLKVISLTNEVHTYAMSGDKRYFRFKRPYETTQIAAPVTTISEADAEKPGGTPQSIDAIYTYDGNRLLGTQPSGVMFSMWNPADFHRDDQFFSPNYYLSLSGRTTPDILGRGKSSPKRVSLQEAISLGQCTVRTKKEDVYGIECVVLDWSGTAQRTVWLDPALNFAIRKQVLYYPKTQLAMWKTVVADFIKVDTSVPLWSPRRASSEYCPGPDAPARLHNRGLVEVFFDVSSLQVNDVPDELFELKIPTGATVLDFTRPRKVDGNVKSDATATVQGADGRLIDLPLVARPKQTKPEATEED